MRRLLLLAALLPLSASAQAPAAPSAAAAVVAPAGPDATTVVRGIQSFYETSKDLRADFTQTYTYKVHKRTDVSTGTLFLKKPGKMRWDYKKPVPRVFVADRNTLWVYEPEANQVFKRSLKSTQLPVALTFMSGEGRLEDEFDTKLLDAPDAASYLLELIPKKNEGDYRSLRLLVDRTTFAVKGSTVVDPVGNTNQIVFASVKTNSDLPEKGFTFVPPEGVRVIEDGRPSGP